MDGRGRLAQSLTWIASWIAPWRGRPSGHGRVAPLRPEAVRSGGGRSLRRWAIWIFNMRVPSGAGLAASGVFLLATVAYGIVVGDRSPAIVDAFRDARDAAADAAGFRIASIALSGERHVSREEILS